MWKAPATFSGTTRERSGGFAAKASRASSEPAATICPEPLALAGVSPAASMASRMTSSCGERTADMPVGVAAAAWAMAVARVRTKLMASSSLSAPARAEAVISPTEWPANRRSSRPSSSLRSRRAATSPAATISGWATAVSLMVSASASVP